MELCHDKIRTLQLSVRPVIPASSQCYVKNIKIPRIRKTHQDHTRRSPPASRTSRRCRAWYPNLLQSADDHHLWEEHPDAETSGRYRRGWCLELDRSVAATHTQDSMSHERCDCVACKLQARKVEPFAGNVRVYSRNSRTTKLCTFCSGEASPTASAMSSGTPPSCSRCQISS